MPITSPQICPILVGRDAEVSELTRLCLQSLRGESSFALISGEAGAGKTRLLEEMTSFAIKQGFQCVIGGCTERDLDFPFSAFVDGLRQRLSENRAAPRLALGIHADVLAELLPEIGRGERSSSSPTSLSPEQGKRHLFEALVAFFDELADQQPLLLVLEDLHWADPTSLELLELLPRRLASTRILVLATSRIEGRRGDLIRCIDTLRRQRAITEISLEPLPSDQVQRMLDALLQSPSSLAIASMIQRKTNGNPFFIEELVASIGPGGDTAWLSDELRVPETVRDTIQLRLQGLDADAWHVVDVAAIIGHRFTIELLSQACGIPRPAVLNAVEQLESRHILATERFERESVLTFRHALTRDVIYLQIPLSQRQLLHRQIAEALEERTRHDAASLITAAELGYHFHQSGVWEKVLEYAPVAGETAWKVHATTEALIHYRRALDAGIALDHPSVAEFHTLCGQALSLLGVFDDARHHLEEALCISRSHSDQSTEQQALYFLSGLYASQDYSHAMEMAEQSLALARFLKDPRREALSLNRLGNILTNVLRLSESRLLHEEALHIFERLDDQWGSADSLDLMAMNHYLSGDVVEARALFRQAASIFESLDDPERLASSITSRGLYLAVIDGPCGCDASPDDFRIDAKQGLTLCREIGWRPGETYALVALACAEIGAGDYGQAQAFAEAALTVATEIDHQQWQVIALLTLGLLRVDLLDNIGAIEHFSEALDLAETLGSTQWEERLKAWLAHCHLRLDDIDLARTVVTQILPANSEAKTIGQRRALATLAEIMLNDGNARESLEVLNTLVQQDTLDSPAELLLLRGDALAACGDRDAANAEYVRARIIASQHGPQGMLWRAAARLADLWRGHNETVVAHESDILQTELDDLASSLSDPDQRDRFLRAAGLDTFTDKPSRHRTARTDGPGGLTPREREVAVWAATGLSNKEIAFKLSIAEKTVEMHVSNCLGKLAFTSRTQLASWTFDQGWSPASEDTG